MVFTDPPYGVSYEAPSGKFDMIINDDKTEDDLVNTLLLPAFKVARSVTLPNAGFYIWHASSTREDFAYAMKAAALIERQYIVWAKPGFILGRSDYRWAHEPCFYASKENRVPAFYGGRSQSTVWRATVQTAQQASVILGTGLVLLDGSGGRIYLEPKAPNGKKVRTMRILPGQSIYVSGNNTTDDLWEIGRDDTGDHPTQKPVALAARAIENSSLPGDIVYDGFLGSGTTLIGAEAIGRICYGTELAPGYCDVIVERYCRQTGSRNVLLNGNAVEWKPIKAK
jgi:DNA modification methylase